MGSADHPGKMDEKLKTENMQKRAVFKCLCYILRAIRVGRLAGVENGAMLTTYLFRYTSECTISWSDFQNFLRLRRQRGIDPLTKILRTFLLHITVEKSLSDSQCKVATSVR